MGGEGQQLAQKDASASSPVVLLPFGNPVSRLLQARTLSCLRNHKVVGGKKKKPSRLYPGPPLKNCLIWVLSPSWLDQVSDGWDSASCRGRDPMPDKVTHGTARRCVKR